MLAPGSAAYSPAHAAVAAGLDSFQVFEREQRNEAFAGRREQFLREHATEMFARHAPDMRLEDIECRTGSCLATLDAPNNEWSHQMVSAVRWGSRYSKRVSAPEGGRVMIEVAVLMDRELLDHATYERYLTDWRRNSVPDLDYLRASMQDAQGGQ